MAVLGRMLQSLTDDHVCEPNEHITVCQRLDSRIPVLEVELFTVISRKTLT